MSNTTEVQSISTFYWTSGAKAAFAQWLKGAGLRVSTDAGAQIVAGHKSGEVEDYARAMGRDGVTAAVVERWTRLQAVKGVVA